MSDQRGLTIENLRGIARGTLVGFAQLTLLTGPNGCGKSTVLEALTIGASRDPLKSIVDAIQRRSGVRNGARWFMHNRNGAVAAVELANAQGTTTTAWTYAAVSSWPGKESTSIKPPFSRILVAEDRKELVTPTIASPAPPGPGASPVALKSYRASLLAHKRRGRLYFAGDNHHMVQSGLERVSTQRLPPSVRFVDPAVQTPLEATYSEAFRQGRRPDFLRLLADLDPRIKSCDLLAEDDGSPALYLTIGESVVPIGVSGDGLQTLARLALELSATPGGLVLVEEPEVCLHPRAIAQAARVMLAAIRRGVQLVVSTHSLELIDAVIGEAGDDDLERIALFNLALDSGELRSSRYAGKDIAYNREVIANDLR